MGAYWIRFRILRQIASRGWWLASLKNYQTLYANSNIDMEMGLSMAEADEILARFGYVEDEALSLAA